MRLKKFNSRSNAGDVKLANTGSDGNWDYDNGIVYHNSAIAFVQTEEGRAIPNGGSYSYQYNLKDHLGNDRVSMDNTGVLQEDEYYAFGLRNPQYDNSNNRYLYNGKEIQTDLTNQYDYGARFYNPVIARWNSIDPHAESYSWANPYNYAFNNPALVVDNDGKDGIVTGTGKKDDPYVIKANYYYYGLDKDEADGVKGAINDYNNSGKTSEIKTDDGPIFVKYDLTAKEAADANDAKTKAAADVVTINDADYKFGNVINSGDVQGKKDENPFGNGGRSGITLDMDKVMAFQKANPGKSLAEIYQGVMTHEIGHNLGGNHGDPGTIMINTGATEGQRSGCLGSGCGTGVFYYTLPSVNKDGTRAIIGRMGMPYGTVGGKYLKDKEVRNVEAGGSVGRLTHK